MTMPVTVLTDQEVAQRAVQTPAPAPARAHFCFSGFLGGGGRAPSVTSAAFGRLDRVVSARREPCVCVSPSAIAGACLGVGDVISLRKPPP